MGCADSALPRSKLAESISHPYHWTCWHQPARRNRSAWLENTSSISFSYSFERPQGVPIKASSETQKSTRQILCWLYHYLLYFLWVLWCIACQDHYENPRGHLQSNTESSIWKYHFFSTQKVLRTWNKFSMYAEANSNLEVYTFLTIHSSLERTQSR